MCTGQFLYHISATPVQDSADAATSCITKLKWLNRDYLRGSPAVLRIGGRVVKPAAFAVGEGSNILRMSTRVVGRPFKQHVPLVGIILFLVYYDCNLFSLKTSVLSWS